MTSRARVMPRIIVAGRTPTRAPGTPQPFGRCGTPTAPVANARGNTRLESPGWRRRFPSQPASHLFDHIRQRLDRAAAYEPAWQPPAGVDRHLIHDARARRVQRLDRPTAAEERHSHDALARGLPSLQIRPLAAGS